MSNVISIFILFIPLLWELWNDRNGDAHKTRGLFKKFNIPSKKIDTVFRGILMVICGGFVSYLENRNPLLCIGVSLAIFLAFFDYLIAYILIRKEIIKGHWYTYLGENNSDNITKNIHPHLRFIIKLLILVVFLKIYL